jgi:hypothetical protein
LKTASSGQTKKNVWSLWALGVSLVLCPALASAQGGPRADLPAVKAGDHWRFEESDQRTGIKEAEFDRKITSVTPSEIQGTENEAKLVLTPELNVVESSTMVVTGDAKLLSFPLEVGKKWNTKYSFANKQSSTKLRFQLEASVVAYEKVKVPAGEFDAFKIEYKGYWNNETTGRNGRIKMTNWFSPDARCIVRNEYDDGHNNWVRQLVEYQLQP